MLISHRITFLCLLLPVAWTKYMCSASSFCLALYFLFYIYFSIILGRVVYFPTFYTGIWFLIYVAFTLPAIILGPADEGC